MSILPDLDETRGVAKLQRLEQYCID